MNKLYIGLKQIVAWPQSKDGAEGYAVRYSDGYESWSPKAVFEDAYVEYLDDDQVRQAVISKLEQLIQNTPQQGPG